MDAAVTKLYVRLAGVALQHDAQLDYYGRKLATCSSDKTIKVFEIANNARTLIDTLVG